MVVYVVLSADPELDDDQVALYAQTEATGFVAWNKGSKPKGKDKGKDKFKKAYRFSHYSSSRPPNKKAL